MEGRIRGPLKSLVEYKHKSAQNTAIYLASDTKIIASMQPYSHKL